MRIKDFASICFLGLALTALPASAQLRAKVTGNRIVVDGVTTGGKVVLAGVEQQSRPWHTVLRTVRLTAEDVTSVGKVEFTLASKAPKRSIWVAMDVLSAHIAMADVAGRGGDGGGPKVTLVGSENGDESFLRVTGRLVTVAVVQAGVGSWMVVAGDGGSSDSGRASDGEVLIAGSAFTGGKNATSALDLRSGDVVAAVDMYSLRWSVVTLGGTKAGSAVAGKEATK